MLERREESSKPDSPTGGARRSTSKPSPDGLTPLGRLGQLANYRVASRDPWTLVFEDHRSSLVAAWAAWRQGVLGGRAPVLIRFDAHLDLGERPRPWAWERDLAGTLDDAVAIANSQRHDDGGWAATALQWGQAAAMATFFVHEYHRFPGDSTPYLAHDGRRVPMWTFGDLAGARDEAPHRWERFLESVEDPGTPLWLDIDMDFATRRDGDTVTPWTDEDWEDELGGEAADLLRGWFARASLVTIATEPDFTGGLKAVGTVAERLAAVVPGLRNL